MGAYVSTTIVNELRFSYTNIGFTFSPTCGTLAGPLADLPNLVFDNDLTGPTGAALELGIDQGFPQGRQHKTRKFRKPSRTPMDATLSRAELMSLSSMFKI